MPNSYNDIKSLPKSVQRLISPNTVILEITESNPTT